MTYRTLAMMTTCALSAALFHNPAAVWAALLGLFSGFLVSRVP